MCPSECDRRQAAQQPMRAVVVVTVAPVLGHAPDFGPAGEHVAVEDPETHRPVEAFDRRVLRRLAGRDVHDLDAMPPGSVAQAALVNSGPLSRRRRRGTQLDQFIERTDSTQDHTQVAARSRSWHRARPRNGQRQHFVVKPQFRLPRPLERWAPLRDFHDGSNTASRRVHRKAVYANATFPRCR